MPHAPHSSSRADHPASELIARALIIRQRHVLTCWSRAGYAYLPGGHVEFGEHAADALARELDEELGAKVRVGALVAAVENAFRTKKRAHHEVSLVFHVELTARTRGLPELHSREPDITFAWTPAPHLRRIDLRPAIIRPLVARLANQASKPRPGSAAWLVSKPWLA